MSDLADKTSVVSFEDRVVALENCPSDTFTALVGAAGMRPDRDLQFGGFTDCTFDGETLRGYNFTGCDLSGSTFNKANILGATFDAARISIAALAKAGDYKKWRKAELKRLPASRHKLDPRRLRDLSTFRESPLAPEMVVIPAGAFLMGSDAADLKLKDDDQASDDEVARENGKRGGKPVGKRLMNIPRRFALARTPVTFDEFTVFCESQKRKLPPDEGWGKGAHPVIKVSWEDAQAYVDWLNKMLGTDAYCLPSEAQWEYACRAGTNTRRWWGDAWDSEQANGAHSFKGGKTSPVDHDGYEANPWGLRDMIGNVWEWCADIYVDNIDQLPDNGIAYEPKKKGDESKGRRVLRGGSGFSGPGNLRAAYRNGDNPCSRSYFAGFRVARTLNP